jgi:hypothetical protein
MHSDRKLDLEKLCSGRPGFLEPGALENHVIRSDGKAAALPRADFPRADVDRAGITKPARPAGGALVRRSAPRKRCETWRQCCHAGSLRTAVVAAQEPAVWHAERCRNKRQDSLVDWLAGFESLDHPRRDGGFCCKFVRTVAACDTKAQDARREGLNGCGSAVSVATHSVGRRRMLRNHRCPFIHQKAASSA